MLNTNNLISNKKEKQIYSMQYFKWQQLRNAFELIIKEIINDNLPEKQQACFGDASSNHSLQQTESIGKVVVLLICELLQYVVVQQ